MTPVADKPFDLELFATIAEARKLEEEGVVDDALDKLFTSLGDEDLTRSVWVLHDVLRGLVGRLEYKGLTMLFEAQHNALLAFSMRFAEEPLVAIYPEHLRWFEELGEEASDDA